MGAVLRVVDVAAAGQLVALLAVLAAALAVGLAGDGGVAAALAADSARRQHHVDGAKAVLDAVAVVLDAAGVQEEARRRRAPQLRRPPDGALGDPRHLGGAARRPVADLLRHLVETDGVLADEIVVEPVVFDHQVQDAVEQGDVAAGFHGEVEIAVRHGGGDARIDHDDFGRRTRALPDVMRRYRGHSAIWRR